MTLFQYLYKNCTYEGQDPSAGAVFNVTVSREGKPLSGVTFNGLGMTGVSGLHTEIAGSWDFHHASSAHWCEGTTGNDNSISNGVDSVIYKSDIIRRFSRSSGLLCHKNYIYLCTT